MKSLRRSNVFLTVVLAAVAAVADYIWLGNIAHSFYAGRLGELLRPFGAQLDGQFLAAVGVYLLLGLSVVYFVLPHAQTAKHAAMRGAIMGFLLYGIYEFTNFAIVEGWPAAIILPDILWGMALLAILSLVGRWVQGSHLAR